MQNYFQIERLVLHQRHWTFTIKFHALRSRSRCWTRQATKKTVIVSSVWPQIASNDVRSPLIGCHVTRKTVQPLVVARLSPLSRQSSFYESSPSIGMVVDHGDSFHTCCRCVGVVPLWPGARVDLNEACLYLKFRMCWSTPCLPTEAWRGLGCLACAALPVDPRQHSRE